jgi:hypothetical protein
MFVQTFVILMHFEYMASVFCTRRKCSLIKLWVESIIDLLTFIYDSLRYKTLDMDTKYHDASIESISARQIHSCSHGVDDIASIACKVYHPDAEAIHKSPLYAG